MGLGGQLNAPASLLPGKATYPLFRKLVGPQVRSGRVQKISSIPEFDPRTVQSVPSRHNDYAIPAHISFIYLYIYIYIIFCSNIF